MEIAIGLVGLAFLGVVLWTNGRYMRELAEGHKTLMEGQKILIEGQRALMEGQKEIAKGMERVAQMAQAVHQGQTEMVRMLQRIDAQIRA
ncbi:MAG TPA: hypothetical protein DCY61_01525 [Dehalococcoidia bacterium]|nr:hypothetical protein [Dehalococcoidia bacterium]